MTEPCDLSYLVSVEVLTRGQTGIGIDRGWEAAYRLGSTLDLAGQELPNNLTP